MICATGYSRFPVYFSENGQRVLGSSPKDLDMKIKGYIKSFGKMKGIVIFSMRGVRFKNRFVVNGKAVNPNLDLSEDIPRKIFIYPDTGWEKPLDGVYARGIILRGIGRLPLFIPMVSMKQLERDEVVALDNTIHIEKIGLARMTEFIGHLSGLTFTMREMGDGNVALTIDDDLIRNDEPYQVLVNSEGLVRDTNVCFDIPGGMYLPEFVVEMRVEGNLVIYSRRW